MNKSSLFSFSFFWYANLIFILSRARKRGRWISYLFKQFFNDFLVFIFRCQISNRTQFNDLWYKIFLMLDKTFMCSIVTTYYFLIIRFWVCFTSFQNFDPFKLLPAIIHVLCIIIVHICTFIRVLRLFLITIMLLIIKNAHRTHLLATTLCVKGIDDISQLLRFGNGEHLVRLVIPLCLKMGSLAVQLVWKIQKQAKENNVMALFWTERALVAKESQSNAQLHFHNNNAPIVPQV